PVLFATTLLLCLKHSSTTTDTFLKLARNSFIGAVFLAGLAMLLKYLPFIEIVPSLKYLKQFSYERFSFFVAPLLFFSFIIFIEKLPNSKFGNAFSHSLLILLIAFNVLIINDNLRNKIIKPFFNIGERYP